MRRAIYIPTENTLRRVKRGAFSAENGLKMLPKNQADAAPWMLPGCALSHSAIDSRAVNTQNFCRFRYIVMGIFQGLGNEFITDCLETGVVIYRDSRK